MRRSTPEALHRTHIGKSFAQRNAGDSLTGRIEAEQDQCFGDAGNTALGAEVRRVGQLDQAGGKRHIAADDLVQVTQIGLHLAHLVCDALKRDGAGGNTVVPECGLEFPINGAIGRCCHGRTLSGSFFVCEFAAIPEVCRRALPLRTECPWAASTRAWRRACICASVSTPSATTDHAELLSEACHRLDDGISARIFRQVLQRKRDQA